MRDDHIKETIYIVKKEIEKKAQHNRLSFWQFLKTQIRFIGWKIWIMQMILQWIIYVCMKKFFSKYYVEHPEDLPKIVMVWAIVVLMTAIPFLYKSFRHRMQEIEAVTYISSVRLMIARLLIVGIGDIILLGSIYAIVVANVVIPKIMLFLCLSVPFLVACNGCLFMVRYLKPKVFLQSSIGLCVLMIGVLIYKGEWWENLFQSGIQGLLLAGLLVVLCFIQIWNMQDSDYIELQIS